MTLNYRITLAVAILISVIISSLLLFVNARVRSSLEDSHLQWSKTLALSLAEATLNHVLEKQSHQVREILRRTTRSHPRIAYIIITDFQGDVFGHTFDEPLPDALIVVDENMVMDESGIVVKDVNFRGMAITETTHPFIERLKAQIRIGVDRSGLRRMIRATTTGIILVGAIILMLGFTGSVVLARKVTWPIRSLSNAMDAYAAGHHIELPQFRKLDSDTKQLVNSFEEMIRQKSQIDEALRKSEETFRSLAENSQDYIMRYDTEGRHLYENPAALRASGLRAEDILGKTHREAGFDESLCDLWEENIARVFTTGEPSQTVFAWESAEGKVYLDWRLFPEFGKGGNIQTILGVSRDVTTLKQGEEDLKIALQEKELLLRELYHRTKNNMQVIRSMLILQAARTPDNEHVQKLMHDTENRILAMSLVHQQLCQSHDLSRINVQEYIDELAHLVMQSYDTSSQNISLILDIEPIGVLLDTALPCGLVLNELLSNTLQHAFPGEREGQISIKLFRNDARHLEVIFSDNGVGVPAKFDFRTLDSLGLQMIHSIVEHQMQGTIRFAVNDGVRCVIEFPDTLYTERV